MFPEAVVPVGDGTAATGNYKRAATFVPINVRLINSVTYMMICGVIEEKERALCLENRTGLGDMVFRSKKGAC